MSNYLASYSPQHQDNYNSSRRSPPMNRSPSPRRRSPPPSSGGADNESNYGKLFVGGIAWDSTEESLSNYFSNFGPVVEVNLKKSKEDPTKHRGFAFVTFKRSEDAEAVLKHNTSHVIDGSKVDPKSACPIGVKPEERTKKIFVGGLQTETTEECLMEYFGKFGEIRNKIEFAVDHVSKRRRGFCFIEFTSEGVVDRIVKDQYHMVAGRKLETKRALSKQQQQEMSASNSNIGVVGLQPSIAGGAMLAYGGSIPYTQPVLYIHPDSLSTAYPLSAMGLATVPTAYPTTYNAATIQPAYQSRDNHHAASSRSAVNRYDPYRKK